MNDSELKRLILNKVAETGSIKLAVSQLRIEFCEFRRLQTEDPYFNSEIKKAESFYLDDYNHQIGLASKQKLLDILLNGITELTVTRKVLESPKAKKEAELNGEEYEPDVEITTKRVYKGTPVSAIAQGLSLIPGLTKAVEEMARNNALDPDTLVEAQNYINTFESGLRKLLTGESKNNTHKLSDDEIIGSLQSLLLGSSSNKADKS